MNPNLPLMPSWHGSDAPTLLYTMSTKRSQENKNNQGSQTAAIRHRTFSFPTHVLRSSAV
eukprot:687608-Hanusia_phi.AAC.1